MDLEEKFQQFTIADPVRIENDLDALGMGAVVAVSRVLHVAAGIADAGVFDAGHLADQILHAPETSAGQNCTFTHLDILHLVKIITIAFIHHVGFGDEPQ